MRSKDATWRKHVCGTREGWLAHIEFNRGTFGLGPIEVVLALERGLLG